MGLIGVDKMEILKIFDENYKEIGLKSRDEVHQYGYFHEVFHCWVIQKIEEDWRIYFQLRSKYKKDYPGQFDISAAGHLLATETVQDGVRELAEELGLQAKFEDLTSLGVIVYKIDHENIKDYEYANVFIYKLKGSIKDFHLQEEELDGIFSASLVQFFKLVNGSCTHLQIEGYELLMGKRILYKRKLHYRKWALYQWIIYRPLI